MRWLSSALGVGIWTLLLVVVGLGPCVQIEAAVKKIDSLTALEVMVAADAVDDGDRSVADLTMVLVDRGGRERVRRIRSFGIDVGEDRQRLMFFLSPADVEGTGFLAWDYDDAGRDDDQWLYLPALKKAKRIASADRSSSFMGSDLSYADMNRWQLEDYDYRFYEPRPEIEVAGQPCWVIEATPRTEEIAEEIGYSRSILFIRKDIRVLVRAVHYERTGGHIKYFDVKSIEQIQGIWTTLEIHMTRKKGKDIVHRTVLRFDDVRYEQAEVEPEMFAVNRLEHGL